MQMPKWLLGPPPGQPMPRGHFLRIAMAGVSLGLAIAAVIIAFGD